MALVASYEENVRRGELEVVMHKAELVKKSSPVARAIAAGATAARNFGGKEVHSREEELRPSSLESLLCHRSCELQLRQLQSLGRLEKIS